MTSILDQPDTAAAPRARDITGTVWRHRWLVALAVLAAVAVGAALTFTAKERYTATAKLLFRDPGLSRTLFGSGLFEGSVDPARNASTNVEIVKSEAVSGRVQRAVGKVTAQLPEDVSVKGTSNADVVSIAATADKPKDAVNVANAYASEYIAFQRDTDRATVSDARETVQEALADATPEERPGLLESARQLRVLETLQTGNAEVIARATPPTSPSTPQPKRNLVIAIFAGLLLGIALALLRERMDRRLNTADEIERALGYQVLAQIPSSRRVGVVDEPFRMLRESLRYLDVTRPHRCIVVTSADAEEGKTSVATNLARMLAAGGERVMLIEADLRRPAASAQLGRSPRNPGLSGVLSGQYTLDEVVQPVGGGGRLQLVSSGPLPPNPADLLHSPLLDEMLQRALDFADHVILDTTPLLPVSDAHVLLTAPSVDGVLVVARARRTRRGRARALARVLERSRQEVLGVAVTDVRVDRAHTGYYAAAPEDLAADGDHIAGSRLVRS
jgi:capsular exopolysaccharide synthesis family protein